MIKELGVLVDNFSTEAMERMDGHFVGIRSDDLPESFTHGTRPAVGERQAENVLRQRISTRQNIGHPHREQFGLAGTRPGYDHQGPVYVIDRLFLSGIQFFVARVKIHSLILSELEFFECF